MQKAQEAASAGDSAGGSALCEPCVTKVKEKRKWENTKPPRFSCFLKRYKLEAATAAGNQLLFADLCISNPFVFIGKAVAASLTEKY